MKRIIALSLVLSCFISTAYAKNLTMKVVGEEGRNIPVSKNDIDYLASKHPNVDIIDVTVLPSARSGTSLFMRYRLTNGTWKENSFGIAGHGPLVQHIDLGIE